MERRGAGDRSPAPADAARDAAHGRASGRGDATLAGSSRQTDRRHARREGRARERSAALRGGWPAAPRRRGRRAARHPPSRRGRGPGRARRGHGRPQAAARDHPVAPRRTTPRARCERARDRPADQARAPSSRGYRGHRRGDGRRRATRGLRAARRRDRGRSTVRGGARDAGIDRQRSARGARRGHPRRDGARRGRGPAARPARGATRGARRAHAEGRGRGRRGTAHVSGGRGRRQAHRHRHHRRRGGDHAPARLEEEVEPDPRPLRRVRFYLLALGPGLVTAFADNDAGGITTYSIAGAQFGFSLMWVLVVTAVALTVTQEAGARLGLATGQGLAGLIREKFGVRWTAFAVLTMLVANLGTTIAEFAGMAAALGLFGVPPQLSALLSAALVVLILARGSFNRIQYAFVAIGAGVS